MLAMSPPPHRVTAAGAGRHVARGRLANVAGALAVAAIVWLVLSACFGDLFPLIEYRYWISSPTPPPAWPELELMLTEPGVFSRRFSMLCWMHCWQLVGNDVDRANLVQIGLQAVTAGALFLWGRRMLPANAHFALALLAGLAFGCGLPACEAAAWQATVHDKFAALFMILALHVAGSVLRPPLDLVAIVRANLLLTPFVLAAHNSKEAAWCLVPTLLVLGAVRQARDARALRRAGPWLRTAAALVVPLLYATWQIAQRLEGAWTNTGGANRQHVLGGDMARNLGSFWAGLLNLPPALGAGLVVATGVAAAALVIAALRDRLRRGDASLLPPIAGTVFSVLLPSGTASGAVYYMFVPGLFVWWLAAECLATCLPAAGRGWRTPTAAAAAIGGALALALVAALWRDGSCLDKARRARNFRAALPLVGERVAAGAPPPLTLAFPGGVWCADQILGVSNERGLARFMLPLAHDASALRALDAGIVELRYDGAPPVGVAAGTLVVFDERLRLLRVTTPAEPVRR